jgi:hypothetical protein
MSYSLKAAVASRLRELIACDDNGTLTSWVIGGAFAKGTNCSQNIDSTWTRVSSGSFSTKVFETTQADDDGGCTWTAGNGPQCLTTGGSYTTIVHGFDNCQETGGSGATGYTGEGESANPYNIRVAAAGSIAPYYGTTWLGVAFTATYDTQASGATIALGGKADGHFYGYFGAEGSSLSEEDLGAGASNAAFNGRYARFAIHSGFADLDYRLYARHRFFAVFNDEPVLADIQSMHDDHVAFFFDVSANSAVPVLMHHYH